MYDILYLCCDLQLIFQLDSDTLSTLSLQATNENAMEEMLRKVEQTWSHAEFDVIHHARDSNFHTVTGGNKDFKEVTYIISGLEQINSLLEESQVAIAALRGSRFIGMDGYNTTTIY